MRNKALAWAVHAYTALGLVTGGLAVLGVLRGDLRSAFLWLAVSTVIDATDGPLARRFRVSEILPFFRGGKLDDLVDYFNYVAVPALILLNAPLLPSGARAAALIPLVSSAYGFSRSDAKTPDGFFTGFPSYWNIVVFYFVYLDTAPAAALAILSVFGLMVFVPLRYIDPFKTRPLRVVTVPLTMLWGLSMFYAIVAMPGRPPALIRLFLYYPYYYFTVSFLLNVRGRSGGIGRG